MVLKSIFPKSDTCVCDMPNPENAVMPAKTVKTKMMNLIFIIRD
jgi:hypothetical protein